MNVNGYETITTFYDDFTIADGFGEDAIKDTYKRAFEGWKDNYKYLTELVMVLNWKCWAHYNDGNNQLSGLYSDLFYEAKDWCYDNLKGDELTYFYKTTD